MFQLNASVFIRAEVMKTDDNCSIQLKCQQGYLIWKLVLENPFPFMQEPTEKQPLYISQKYSLSEFYLEMLSLANVKEDILG